MTTQEWPSLLSLCNKKPRQAVWHLSKESAFVIRLWGSGGIHRYNWNYISYGLGYSSVNWRLKRWTTFTKRKAQTGLRPTLIKSALEIVEERALWWHNCGRFCVHHHLPLTYDLTVYSRNVYILTSPSSQSFSRPSGNLQVKKAMHWLLIGLPPKSNRLQ